MPALGALLPSPADARLLRGCLPSGERGRDAFVAWERAVGDPVAALRSTPGRGELLPLLLHAARANGTALPGRLTSYLRAAWVHEEVRGDALAGALGDLEATAVLLPGAGLVASTYGAWPLRHCHDLDLLVTAVASREVRPDGVGIARHVTLGPHPVLRPDAAGARARAVRAELAGREVRVLAPADALVHICLTAASRSAPRPRWAVDVWWLCHTHDVAWPVLVEQARAGRCAALLRAQLGWAARELGAAVPQEVLVALGRAASAPRSLLGLRATLGLARRRVGARAVLRGALSP